MKSPTPEDTMREELEALRALNAELLAALQAIDERLRACTGPVSATEAYDSFYQEIVAEAIANGTGRSE